MRAELGLFTPEEVSLMTGLSLATLATWRSRGKGPSYVKIGRKVYYRKQELSKWLEKQIRETGNEHRNKERKTILPVLGTKPRVVKGHRLGRHRTQSGRSPADAGGGS
jgi:predicted DNA-binding transcriptional regulator AlpA